ncbi:MAG: hypothetical protein IKI30_08805 [Oxalobacter sp.]|nr:hypothetical protein [Oxalobacter sp.]
MDRFGIPNKNELKRMNKRQLKKGHYGPYQQICAEIVINLNAPLTIEDVQDSIWVENTEKPEYVDLLFGWLIPHVEKYSCYVSCGSASFDKNIQTIEAIVEYETRSPADEDKLLDCIKALKEHPKVDSIDVKVCDAWRYDDINQESLVLKTLAV